MSKNNKFIVTAKVLQFSKKRVLLSIITTKGTNKHINRKQWFTKGGWSNNILVNDVIEFTGKTVFSIKKDSYVVVGEKHEEIIYSLGTPIEVKVVISNKIHFEAAPIKTVAEPQFDPKTKTWRVSGLLDLYK